VARQDGAGPWGLVLGGEHDHLRLLAHAERVDGLGLLAAEDDRDALALEETAHQAARHGVRTLALTTDVAAYPAVERLMSQTVSALGRLDIERLKGQSVAVEVINQAGPETFIKEFVVTWLRARGVRVVTAAESPALRVKAFASALGLDTEETFIGIPAFQAPVLNLGIPEIALFKWQRNRSVAELRLYEFDAKSDAIVNAPPPGIGRSKFDKFKILLVFGFNVTDAEDHD